jgi:NitT/TauT family transport system permease protein
MALFPYEVILQVTPVVAIAPLILIWVGFERISLALVIIAWIVAFFPILSGMTLGLRSADADLTDLFRLYGASRWQRILRLQIPGALPYLLSAMKISGGLALIGAVVAEFAAGSGTATGLAWRIVEAGNRLEIAKMFAALGLLSALGIANFYALTALEYAFLHRWHESARKREL